MQNIALLEIFHALSAWQCRAARNWVISPAFNQREAPVRLFDYLLDCRASNLDFSPEKAMKVVFGSKKGTIAKLRHEMSALSNMLRDFLAWQEIQEIPGQKEWLRVRVFRKLRLEKNFQLAIRDAEKVFQTPQTMEQHLFAFRVGREQYEWAESQKRGHEFSLETLNAALDAWYAGQLLQLACMEQSRQNLRRADTTTKLFNRDLDGILALLPSAPQDQIPAIAIYKLGQRMLAQPEDAAAIAAYREMLATLVNHAPTSEARDLLMLAINHGIRRINAGDQAAIRHTLEFYLLGLEKKLLHDERGHLSKFTYNNVLMTFLALEEWEDASLFLDKFRRELSPSEQENIFQYNRAIYHFRRGDFDAALELLRVVTLPDPMYKLECRKMLLKIYFEQDATAALESLLENLLLWLRRHGEIGYHREMYRNLVRFTGQLLRLPPGNNEGRKKLERKILDTPLVAERTWLLEKVRSR